jgi:glc operon protein GlcG
MNRKRIGIVLVAAVAALAAMSSGAMFAQGQAPAAGQPPAGAGRGGPGGGRGGAPAQLDFATAKKAVDATEAAANAANVKVAIAVVDANGDLVYFRRMDGIAGIAVTASQAKARAAILFGVSTKSLQDAVAAGTAVHATVTPAAATGAPIMAVQGGLPIMKAGKVIGAIGVGGSTSQNDEIFGQAGVDAVK